MIHLRNRLLLLFSLFLFSCQNKDIDIEKIKRESWKNNGGAWFSDTINFMDKKGGGFYLDSDLSVYFDGKLIGTVIKGDAKEMIIRTLKNEESHFVSYANRGQAFSKDENRMYLDSLKRNAGSSKKTDQTETEIKSKQSAYLKSFESEIINWTEEDIKLKKMRKAIPFYIEAKEVVNDKLIITLRGVQGGRYSGNIEIKNNSEIILYYWLDPNKEAALSLFQQRLIYALQPKNLKVDYSFKLVSLSNID